MLLDWLVSEQVNTLEYCGFVSLTVALGVDSFGYFWKRRAALDAARLARLGAGEYALGVVNLFLSLYRRVTGIFRNDALDAARLARLGAGE